MAEQDFNRIEKLVSYKTKSIEQPRIQEDLRVQASQTKETQHLENVNSFQELLSYYLKEVQHSEAMSPAVSLQNKEKAEKAMQEAEQTFKMMMEISSQLRQAFQNIMKM
jgi:flagellar hook-basal body complex protein FliE